MTLQDREQERPALDTGASTFYDRINKIELTKKERLVAQYFLDNSTESGFMTANSIARKLNISDVTVIRFARKLGYAGFPELQEALQQEVVKKLEKAEKQLTVPRERLSHAMEDSTDKSLFQLAVEGLVDNLDTLREKNSDEVFARTADLLFHSRRKVVMGFRGCAGTAMTFYARLAYLLDNVTAVTHDDPDDYGQIFNLRKGDCILVIGFNEYQRTMVDLVRYAQKQDVSVIAITDKETSPLAFRSTASIFCSIKGISFNSFSTVTLATEIIAAHLVKLTASTANQRNKDLLDYMKQTNYFWNLKEA